jgi:hypothetical protein
MIFKLRFKIVVAFYTTCLFVLNAQVTSMPAGAGLNSVSVCSGTFTDQSPGGNYSSNQNSTLTICPSTPGMYVSITFTSFNTESGFDFLRIYNGDNGTARILASLTGTTLPGTYTASGPNGCLTFRFRSDGSGNRAGWVANVSCSATPGPTPGGTSTQDCGLNGGTSICNDASFSGNSSGAGNNDFAILGDDGCLGGENQSSWYYFSPVSAGTLSFNIIPANGTDDYDFAIWGPTTSLQCPSFSLLAPIRCSYSGVNGNTGLGNGATDFSEDASGDSYVAPLTVSPGQFYTMLIDNFSTTMSPFNLDWTFGGGASLNCSVLPIVLLNFDGEIKESSVILNWATASEKNNAYFLIERSSNGEDWDVLKRIKGAGNSSFKISYSCSDDNPLYGVSYYRLKQVDYDGKSVLSQKIVVDNKLAKRIVPFPNPSINSALKLQIQGLKDREMVIELKSLVGETIILRSIKSEMDNWEYDLSSHAAKGTYLLSVKSNDYAIIKKVLIE